MDGLIAYPCAAGALTTRVIEAGSGDDVVVFIHGVGARADRWRLNLPAFAQAGYRCLALDLPGHGYATKGADPQYDVPGFSDMLKDFLDHLGISRVTLVGTSLGGHVAAHFACSHRDMVQALVLVGSAGLVPIGPETGRSVQSAIQESSRESIDAKLKFVFADTAIVTPELVEEEHRINTSPGAAEAFEQLGQYFAEKIDDDVVGPRLASLIPDLAVLLVWGEDDQVIPLAVGEKARDILAGTELVVVPGVGHAPYMEAPQFFDARVLEFLAGARS